MYIMAGVAKVEVNNGGTTSWKQISGHWER